jgi:hypothetical protein
MGSKLSYKWWTFIPDVIVYGGLVAIIISALFTIDFLYRHFAP